MNMLILSGLILSILGCGFSFVFGLMKFFKRKAPLYVQLVTMGIGCALLSRIYYLVIFVCYGSFSSSFDVGYIGDAGFFLFLFSSNYGQVDSLVDDRSPKLKKYRIIPVVSFIIAVAAGISVFVFSEKPLSGKIATAVIFAAVSMAMYYNIKHLIIPDVELGIVSCLRFYNALTIAVELLFIIFYLTESVKLDIPMYISELLILIISFFFTPVLYKGVSKWWI